MFIEDLQEACRRAMSGQQSALEELGLDNAEYHQPRPRSTEMNSLQRNYYAVLNTAVAARELQLNFLERQCSMTLDYMQTIANARNVQLDHKVDGQDVAEIMLALIDEEMQRHIRPEIEEGSQSDSDDNAVLIRTSHTPENLTRTKISQQSTATDKTGVAKEKERPDAHHADVGTAEKQPPDKVQPATSPPAHHADASTAEQQPPDKEQLATRPATHHPDASTAEQQPPDKDQPATNEGNKVSSLLTDIASQPGVPSH